MNCCYIIQYPRGQFSAATASVDAICTRWAETLRFADFRPWDETKEVNNSKQHTHTHMHTRKNAQKVVSVKSIPLL